MSRSKTLGIGMITAACVVVGFFLFALSWSLSYPDLDVVPPHEEGLIAARLLIDIALGLIACGLLPLVLRARTPSRAAGLAALVMVAASGASDWAWAASLVAIVAVAAWRDRRWLIAINSVGVAALVLNSLRDPLTEVTPAMVLAAVAALGLPCLLGLYLGSRRALLASYRDQAESARRERDARIAMVRAEERTAIAREMHDTVSHRLALISLHAGALALRDDLPEPRRAEAAKLIQATAQHASEELRALLTMLRAEAHGTGVEPGIADLDAIVGEFRGQDAEIVFRFDPELRTRLEGQSALASRALRLVVREGLANATKHAPGTPVTVDLDDDDGVTVRVRNPLPAEQTGRGGGYGLVGLEERLTVAGGWLRAGPGDGQFVLEAWLPW